MEFRLIKLPVIIHPASDNRIEHEGQILKRLVGHSVHPPLLMVFRMDFAASLLTAGRKLTKKSP